MSGVGNDDVSNPDLRVLKFSRTWMTTREYGTYKQNGKDSPETHTWKGFCVMIHHIQNPHDWIPSSKQKGWSKIEGWSSCRGRIEIQFLEGPKVIVYPDHDCGFVPQGAWQIRPPIKNLNLLAEVAVAADLIIPVQDSYNPDFEGGIMTRSSTTRHSKKFIPDSRPVMESYIPNDECRLISTDNEMKLRSLLDKSHI